MSPTIDPWLRWSFTSSLMRESLCFHHVCNRVARGVPSLGVIQVLAGLEGVTVEPKPVRARTLPQGNMNGFDLFGANASGQALAGTLLGRAAFSPPSGGPSRSMEGGISCSPRSNLIPLVLPDGFWAVYSLSTISPECPENPSLVPCRFLIHTVACRRRSYFSQ